MVQLQEQVQGKYGKKKKPSAYLDILPRLYLRTTKPPR